VVARREMMSGSDLMLANAFLWHPRIRALWKAEPPTTRFMEFAARIRMAAGRPESWSRFATSQRGSVTAAVAPAVRGLTKVDALRVWRPRNSPAISEKPAIQGARWGVIETGAARCMPPGADGGGCPRPSPLPSGQAKLGPDHDHRGRGELGARAASPNFGDEQLIMSLIG
jgi:hypothetical protein